MLIKTFLTKLQIKGRIVVVQHKNSKKQRSSQSGDHALAELPPSLRLSRHVRNSGTQKIANQIVCLPEE